MQVSFRSVLDLFTLISDSYDIEKLERMTDDQIQEVLRIAMHIPDLWKYYANLFDN